MFGSRFKGVFPSDKVPNLKQSESAIVNLDDSSQPGSHWIAIVKHDGHLLVYDSFGRSSKRIAKFLGANVVDAEHDAEQRDAEENCGQRSLSFLKVYYTKGAQAALSI